MAEETTKTTDALLNETGASWTKILWGFISEEYNPDLTGTNWLKKYDEMRKSDAQIFATLLAMELPIRSTLWNIEPGQTEAADGEYITTDEDYIIANFIEKCLFEKMEITWDDFIRQALTMTAFWFSLFEKVFKFDGDKIVLKKLAQRLPWSVFKWETADGLPGVQQVLSTQTPNGTSTPSIPAEKLVRFTFRQEGDNYEGTSVLRSAYKHWYIKDTLYKLDAVKHERQSVWIPVLKIPKGATAADKMEAENIMENLRSTEQTYVILPGDDWHFEFADLKAGSQSKMEESIAHHNREISKNILAQFLELWAGSGGSYALSEDQSDLFLISLAAIARQIAETLNRDLIKQLVDLNFTLWENQTYPKLKFNKLGDVDYAKLSSSLSTLAGAGIIQPDKDLEDHVRTVFDLPKRLEEISDEEKEIREKQKNEEIEKKKKEEEKKRLENIKIAWFSDEAEAKAFEFAKNTFNIYDILKIQNYGNK
jgi:phage gp29-like protein